MRCEAGGRGERKIDSFGAGALPAAPAFIGCVARRGGVSRRSGVRGGVMAARSAPLSRGQARCGAPRAGWGQRCAALGACSRALPRSLRGASWRAAVPVSASSRGSPPGRAPAAGTGVRRLRAENAGPALRAFAEGARSSLGPSVPGRKSPFLPPRPSPRLSGLVLLLAAEVLCWISVLLDC